MILVDSVIVCI